MHHIGFTEFDHDATEHDLQHAATLKRREVDFGFVEWLQRGADAQLCFADEAAGTGELRGLDDARRGAWALALGEAPRVLTPFERRQRNKTARSVVAVWRSRWAVSIYLWSAV